MSQKETLIDLFERNGNVLTLGQIMQTNLAAEYRARMSELRREGYTIALERGSIASENIYRLYPPLRYEGEQAVFA